MEVNEGNARGEGSTPATATAPAIAPATAPDAAPDLEEKSRSRNTDTETEPEITSDAVSPTTANTPTTTNTPTTPFGFPDGLTKSNDPFGMAGQGSGIDQPKFTKEVHIRIFKRNGRKCCTTLSLDALPELQSASRSFVSTCSKKFSCNGSFKKKDNLIKFSGDVRKGLSEYLVEAGFAKKSAIKIHGF